MRRILAVLAIVSLVACDKPPSPSEAREWTPADHDRAEENARIAQGQSTSAAAGSGRPPMAMPTGKEAEELVDQLWAKVCSSCHGASGRGDGPTAQQSSDIRPPDLADAAWQAKVSDAQIASAIKNGKGKMPNYRFPDPFVEGLTKKVRAFAHARR